MTPKNFELAQRKRELTFLEDEVSNDDGKVTVLFIFQQLVKTNLTCYLDCIIIVFGFFLLNFYFRDNLS